MYDSLQFDSGILNDELITPNLRVLDNSGETFINISENSFGDQINNEVMYLTQNRLTIKKGLFVYSDSRIKTNITSLGKSSTLLFKITPKLYNMLGQSNNRNKIGFIAQNF